MVTDPVCGMVLTPAQAAAVRTVSGEPQYFCSAACAAQFGATPPAYRAAAGPTRTAASLLWGKALACGLLAAAGLLGFYLGVIALGQDSTHAWQQLAEDRWFVGAIAAGFGTQIGLFTYLHGRRTRARAGGVAASTGASTAAMLACCAHHLVDVLPVIGLSGAALFLNAYKTPLLWLGILLNLAGIAYLLRTLRPPRRRGAAEAAEAACAAPPGVA